MTQFLAKDLRKTVLQMAFSGSAVHIGCAFSIIEVLAVLYRGHLRYPKGDPNSLDRDFLILSKGHGVMAQYACLYEKGWVSKQDIDNYFNDGSLLKGLSDVNVIGCEVTSGSLGHGLSVGIGMALGSKLNKRDQFCYAVVGDGEMNEGAIWEGIMFAKHRKLDNLIVIVDENGFQAMGETKEVIELGSLCDKFSAFGFEALIVDGHDEEALEQAISSFKANPDGRPKAVIAQTIKGKGVSFMEGNNSWHYSRLTSKSFKLALLELDRFT
jgi:transketolase